MRIVVISSCTGDKSVADARALTRADFQKGPAHVEKRERQLEDKLTPASQLYSGQQHVRLLRGLTSVNGAFTVDLFILSAGYGLVRAERLLAPYECTFAGMSAVSLRKWADRLAIPESVRAALAPPYDLALILLGDSYIKACALDDSLKLGGLTLLLCGQGAARRLPSLPLLRIVPASTPEASLFRCPLVGLKGELAARLLSRLAASPSLVSCLRDPATDILAFIEGKEPLPSPSPATRYRPNPRVDQVIELSREWQSLPHRNQLAYFIPEWDDLVDPDFDFLADTHSGNSADWSNEVYAHQLHPAPCYDGILISKVVAEKSKRKKERINSLGVHRFLRVPRNFPVMGDCGAFGYIKEDSPPYTTSEILDYYTRLGFDYGVSIDHLITRATESVKKHRYQLTIQNAEDFLVEHRRRGLSWQPIGAVQGWDAKSYADAARKYVEMGYTYIALGGLVRTTTPEILRIVQEVHEVVPPSVRLHLFGLARLRGLRAFSRLGIRSIDSASYLRQAWMRGSQGYLLPEDAYAALRIPESGKSFRAKRMAGHAGIDEGELKKREGEALRCVRALARNDCSIDTCLNALLAYDRFVTSERVDMTALYRKTLEARPWERCRCAICSSCGIEAIIFRGSNRNRRRGFHNTFVFYQLLQRILAGEEVGITSLEIPEREPSDAND